MNHLWESAAVAIGAVICWRVLRIYFVKRKIQNDFDYAMSVMSKGAVRRARIDHKLELNFSASSIETLEAMLERIHEAHLKQPMTEKELSVQSIRWGAYIGEVMKRVRPARWQRNSEKAGGNTMPLVFDSANEAFPCSWAYKRIADGPEDNILFKFQVFSNPELRKYLEAGPNAPPTESATPIN